MKMKSSNMLLIFIFEMCVFFRNKQKENKFDWGLCLPGKSHMERKHGVEPMYINFI